MGMSVEWGTVRAERSQAVGMEWPKETGLLEVCVGGSQHKNPAAGVWEIINRELVVEASWAQPLSAVKC